MPTPETRSSRPARGLRLSLRGLLYYTAALAAALAAFSGWGLLVFAALIALLCVDPTPQKPRWWRPTISESLTTVAIIGVLIGLLMPAATSGPHRRLAWARLNNMKQLAMGIIVHDSTHKQFPRSHTTSLDGKKLHSWRAVILPELDEWGVHGQIDFDVAWDDAAQVIDTYTPLKDYELVRLISPSAWDPSTSNETNYFAVVDESTLWSPNSGASLDDVTDRFDQTILLIEAVGLGIPWAEPRDLSMEEAIDLLVEASSGQPRESFQPSGWYTSIRRLGDGTAGRSIAMADGSTHLIGRFKDRATARAYLTRSGGEQVPDIDDCVTWIHAPPGHGETVVHWNRVVATARFVGLAVLPAFRRPRRWLFK